LLAFDCVANGSFQVHGNQRLFGQEIRGPGLDGFHVDRLIAFAGEHDDGRPTAFGDGLT
jgi:hypothetical protein